MTKKTLTKTACFIAIMMTGLNTFGQSGITPESFHIMAVLLAFTLLAVVIVYILKLLLNFRLKNKVIDRGIDAELAAQLIQPAKNNQYRETVKWVLLLVSLGIGLLVVSKTPPFGIHSIIILVFSMAAGFTGYLIFLHKEHRHKD